MEPLCVCVCGWQWSFWFHTEQIFLHYYVTINFSIRFLRHVVYGTCSDSAYGREHFLPCLVGWLAGRSVGRWSACRLFKPVYHYGRYVGLGEAKLLSHVFFSWRTYTTLRVKRDEIVAELL